MVGWIKQRFSHHKVTWWAGQNKDFLITKWHGWWARQNKDFLITKWPGGLDKANIAHMVLSSNHSLKLQS
jgi:hypothetical protein